jgi:flagellar biosynthesis chaperone FliJ
MEARYAKAAAAKANKEFLTQTQPTQEYISNLDKDIADKVKADGTYEEYTEYSQNEFEAPKKRSVKINSFQEEKKEVMLKEDLIFDTKMN